MGSTDSPLSCLRFPIRLLNLACVEGLCPTLLCNDQLALLQGRVGGPRTQGFCSHCCVFITRHQAWRKGPLGNSLWSLNGMNEVKVVLGEESNTSSVDLFNTHYRECLLATGPSASCPPTAQPSLQLPRKVPLDFTDEPEAQLGQVTCPKAHS